MKQKRIIIICSIFLLLLFNTGCAVHKSEAEIKDLKSEISALQRKLEDSESELENLKLEFNEYKEEMSSYEELSDKELELAKIETKKKLEEIKAEEEAEAKSKKEEDEKVKYETDITYDQLARTPDDYKLKRVKFSGKVAQVVENMDTVELRLAINDNYDTIIYMSYRDNMVSSRILKGDHITVYGVTKGLKTYTSTMGSQITVPQISVIKIEQ